MSVQTKPEGNAASETKHGSKPAGRRSVARLLAVQALYEIAFSGSAAEAVIEDFRVSRIGQEIDGEQLRQADAEWFADIVRGTMKRQGDIDGHIAAILPRPDGLARMEAVLQCCFRAAAYELMLRIDVPAGTIIDEYLGLVRAFFDVPEIKLANGILDALARRLRPNEF